MDTNECRQVFRANPQNAKNDSAYRQRDDRIRNGIEGARICAETFHLTRMTKNHPRRVSQPKNECHERHATDVGLGPRREPRVDDRAEEKFLHQPRFDTEPDKTKRQTYEQLMRAEFSLPHWSRRTAEKILEENESSANGQDHRQMPTGHGAEAFDLNTKIAQTMAEKKAIESERNGDEDDELLRQHDKEMNA